jgi:hypothetical protein
MKVNRYIQIQAVKLHDNSLIPIWDERISFHNGEDCSDYVRVSGVYQDIHNVTSAVYDLETRTVLTGVEIDFYPDKTEFQKGGKVLYETARYRHLKEAAIDISYLKNTICQ